MFFTLAIAYSAVHDNELQRERVWGNISGHIETIFRMGRGNDRQKQLGHGGIFGVGVMTGMEGEESDKLTIWAQT